MQDNTKAISQIKRFRIIGLLEGISFLVLLGIGMPLKYIAGIPEVVKVVGWAHGLLFVLFILGVLQVKSILRWSLLQVGAAFLASVIPFGTFILDKKVKKQELKFIEEATAFEKA
jgi:integral membrane protein